MYYLGYENILYRFILTSTATLLIALGLFLFFFDYLNNSSRTAFFSKPVASTLSIKKINEELENIKLKLAGTNLNNSNTDIEEFNDRIEALIQESITSEKMLHKINNKYSLEIIQQNNLEKIDHGFNLINNRIKSEIVRLTKSANINMLFGSIITIMAVIALGYEVFSTTITFNDMIKLLSHYIPRITLLIFIELFAFFFLKIYKANLADIKYYHNEKTKIDLKRIALKTAINNQLEESTKKTIEQLANHNNNDISDTSSSSELSINNTTINKLIDLLSSSIKK